MRRVHIVGNSGSGKSTLSRALGRKLAVPVLELDSVFHQPNWKSRPIPEFRAEVEQFVGSHERWIVEGNYSQVRDIVWREVDTVIWCHPPRLANLRAIVARTTRRFAKREVLWNGNREPIRNFLSLNPKRSIIAWTWARHPVVTERYGECMRKGDPSGATWIHLRSYAAIGEWLANVNQPAT